MEQEQPAPQTTPPIQPRPQRPNQQPRRGRGRRKKELVYAFIDSQNLNLSIQALGWHLDFARFRTYLRDKYNVDKAYIFIGFIDDNNELYDSLREAGYILVFKQTLTYKDGTTKGNVDAELVLHAMIHLNTYDKALIVTGDGDFYCLIEYLIQKQKLSKVIVPNQHRYSALLKRFDSDYLAFVSDLKSKLAYVSKRKEPRADQPAEGAFRGDYSDSSKAPTDRQTVSPQTEILPPSPPQLPQ
jgi:uncharacterized LabA/DUF88 family protein